MGNISPRQENLSRNIDQFFEQKNNKGEKMRDWKDYLRTQEIKVVNIESIKPFENNPRLNKKAVPAVAVKMSLRLLTTI